MPEASTELKVERRPNGFLRVELPPRVISQESQDISCYRAAYKLPTDPHGQMHIFTVPPADFSIEARLRGATDLIVDIVFQKSEDLWCGVNASFQAGDGVNAMRIYRPGDVEYKALELLLAEDHP